MVLSYDSYMESIDKMQVDKSNELGELNERIKEMSLEHKKDKLESMKQFQLVTRMLNELNKGKGKDGNEKRVSLEDILNNNTEYDDELE